MMEPRVQRHLLTNDSVTFLGGTPEFDLWAYKGNFRGQLRINSVSSEYVNWDRFSLPLRTHPPRHTHMYGQWGQLSLTRKQVDEINTYLRCFAPWVLGSNLTEESNDV